MEKPDVSELLRDHALKLEKIAAKRKRGRPLTSEELKLIGWQEDEQPAKSTSYDSIGAAAAGLGVSVSVLRKAKRAGAPGFRGSRVYPAELLPWLKEKTRPLTPPLSPGGGEGEDKETLERRLLAIKIERQQFFYAADKKDYVPAADAARWATELVTEFVKVLDAIPGTLAPDIVGVPSVAEAELRIRAALDAARRTLHESPWGNSQKEKTTETR